MKKSLKLFCMFVLAAGIISCGGNADNSSSKAKATTKASSGSGGDANSDAQAATPSNRKGKLVYKQYCVICHGTDGKLGVSDATDLTTSTATLEDRIEQITNGKGLMTPYKDILSEDQIKSVAEYVEELRQ